MKLFATFAAACLVAAGVCAQGFPSKPVNLMVPYPAGGVSDVIARKVNQPLAKALGQPVIIENLGGAGGSIAAQKVLNAPADGYNLFQGSPNELILGPLALSAVKYKPEDFRMVQKIAVFPIAVMARKDLPASNADELAAYAIKMAKEGKPMTYASVGVGSFYHLLGEQMAQTLGAQMLHVPYKGGAPVFQDLLGGQVDIFISVYGAPHVEMDKQGKVKFIAALSPQRQPLIPHVATVDEGKALKGFHHSIGTGYYVPSGTPEPVVAALNKALAATLGDADVRSALQAQGADVAKPMALDEAAKAHLTEVAQFKAIAKSINLQPQ
jgi:tripartite-type tricarboxylate transporter receptor subunit TctC